MLHLTQFVCPPRRVLRALRQADLMKSPPGCAAGGESPGYRSPGESRSQAGAWDPTGVNSSARAAAHGSRRYQAAGQRQASRGHELNPVARLALTTATLPTEPSRQTASHNCHTPN